MEMESDFGRGKKGSRFPKSYFFIEEIEEKRINNQKSMFTNFFFRKNCDLQATQLKNVARTTKLPNSGKYFFHYETLRVYQIIFFFWAYLRLYDTIPRFNFGEQNFVQHGPSGTVSSRMNG